MLRRASGCYRDFTIFCAFLVLFNSLVQSVYGQQGIPDLPSGVVASGGIGSFRQPPSQPSGATNTSVPVLGTHSTFRQSGTIQSVSAPAAPLTRSLSSASTPAQLT